MPNRVISQIIDLMARAISTKELAILMALVTSRIAAYTAQVICHLNRGTGRSTGIIRSKTAGANARHVRSLASLLQSVFKACKFFARDERDDKLTTWQITLDITLHVH